MDTEEKKETENGLFNGEDLANIVNVTEAENIFSDLENDSDDIGDAEQLKNESAKAGVLNEETPLGDTPTPKKEETPPSEQTKDTEQPTDNIPTPGTGGITKPGFQLDLSMIPGAMMLDMIDNTTRGAEMLTERLTGYRNIPGLGMSAEQKKMLEPIADACMKDAHLSFKTPWHALGTGIVALMITNAVFGSWEKIKEGEKKKEFESITKSKRIRKVQLTEKKTSTRRPGETRGRKPKAK